VQVLYLVAAQVEAVSVTGESNMEITDTNRIMNREYQNDLISEIPTWKRCIICYIIERKSWKIAKAYNRAAKHDFDFHECVLFDKLRARSEAAWAEVYSGYHGEITEIHKNNIKKRFKDGFTKNQA